MEIKQRMSKLILLAYIRFHEIRPLPTLTSISNHQIVFCRQAVATKAGVDPKSELDFTTDRIETNFSNYSAWHYRSKLLPLIHPSSCTTNSSSSFPVAEEAHHKELDLVQNAAFTDPEDSSAWLYHAWLAGRSRTPPAIVWLSSGDWDLHLLAIQCNAMGSSFRSLGQFNHPWCFSRQYIPQWINF